MGSPHSSFIFLLLIAKLFIQCTGQNSSHFASFFRAPWAFKASDMCDSAKDCLTPRSSPRYQPEASRAPQARHRLLRGRAPDPDADRASPLPPNSIAAASLPRTQ
ncbi:hypothetical protein HPB48_004720 [Haemaphysalis longicornis]|uniref:Secreted protein n=1 Tax=Haemaphysalis longicornis TaxID=44386 RepID=A0A9J6G0E2_HAELO|nr:hypothetical protein HPB48_004720 [Haemaphysalis longicornis]